MDNNEVKRLAVRLRRLAIDHQGYRDSCEEAGEGHMQAYHQGRADSFRVAAQLVRQLLEEEAV
jgi:hypothetical protein